MIIFKYNFKTPSTMTTLFKLSDQIIVIAFLVISLLTAGMIGYFDEAKNSFQFISDTGSVITTLFIALLLTSISVGIFFISESFKLDKRLRIGLSLLLQLAIVILISIV